LVCSALSSDVFTHAMDVTQRGRVSSRFVDGYSPNWISLLYNDQSFRKIWHEPLNLIDIMNWPLFAGSVFGALAVLLGAYGAHGLDSVFEKSAKVGKAFESAVIYQIFHSLLLVVLGLGTYIQSFRLPSYVWATLIVSIFFFCFSIYGWVLLDFDWLRSLTPFGGIGFVCSWLMLAHLAWAKRNRV